MSSKVTLRSSDGENFEVDIAVVADQSPILKKKIEEQEEGTVISLPSGIGAKILSKVIDYCKRHAATPNDPNLDKDLMMFDAEFIKVDPETLYRLLRAADYLEIQSLIDLAYKEVGNLIEGKTPEEMEKTLRINFKNDVTPEEDEQCRRDNPWAYE